MKLNKEKFVKEIVNKNNLLKINNEQELTQIVKDFDINNIPLNFGFNYPIYLKYFKYGIAALTEKEIQDVKFDRTFTIGHFDTHPEIMYNHNVVYGLPVNTEWSKRIIDGKLRYFYKMYSMPYELLSKDKLCNNKSFEYKFEGINDKLKFKIGGKIERNNLVFKQPNPQIIKELEQGSLLIFLSGYNEFVNFLNQTEKYMTNKEISILRDLVKEHIIKYKNRPDNYNYPFIIHSNKNSRLNSTEIKIVNIYAFLQLLEK